MGRFPGMHTKRSAARPACEIGECRPWPEKFAAEQPTKAVAAALGVGLLLNLLPIGRMAGSRLRGAAGRCSRGAWRGDAGGRCAGLQWRSRVPRCPAAADSCGAGVGAKNTREEGGPPVDIPASRNGRVGRPKNFPSLRGLPESQPRRIVSCRRATGVRDVRWCPAI